MNRLRDLQTVRRAASPFCVGAARRGFTLIELLITMAIIAILAVAMLGASNAAFEAARVSKTKSTIAKIHGLLNDRYQTYTTRRVNVEFGGNTYAGIDVASARLGALRYLMKLEMPDRWSDILGAANQLGAPVSNNLPGSIAGPPVYKQFQFPLDAGGTGTGQIAYPPLAKNYLRRYNALNSNDEDVITSNQSAECLYLIVMLSTGDGEARTLFTDQEIADTDGDGAFEFVDGWGQAISFLRWPAGYNKSPNLMTGDPEADHDPFDPFRRDPAAYRLVPLIFSSGADGVSDINSKSDDYVAGLNPYDPGSGTLAGTIEGEAAADNITNQDLQN